MINCVLVRWTDPQNKDYNNPGAIQILNSNAILTSPNVIGLDPDLEYFVKREPFPYPNVDHRIQAVKTSEWIFDEQDTEYPELKVWKKTYETIARSKDEIKDAVEEEEANANNVMFPYKNVMKYIGLYAAIVRREAKGLSITAKQQEILDKVEAKLEKLWNNHILREQKNADIDSENPIDVDYGWEKEE